jgi:filamentous hemagglutinin family protein
MAGTMSARVIFATMPRKVHPIPSLTALTCLVLAAPAGAQVTADGTLGTTVTPSGATTYTITGGQFQGPATLLQSFGDFSLPNTTDTAHFDLGNASYGGAANGVNVVIGRVTGGNLSTINGQIRLTGGNAPDLFLINPSGIVFGAGATLNVPGSFVASTAENVLFANNVAFGIGNTPDPLLTITAPTGLQLSSSSGEILVQGTGHLLAGGAFSPLDRSNNPTGLQVGTGNSLSFIGNGVTFAGGVAGVNGGGHLEVGSVSQGQVRLNAAGGGWVGDYAGISQLSDIQMTQQSLLDASGSQGSIQLQGRNISLAEGSTALIQNLGTQPSGGITVNAAGVLSLTGGSSNGVVGSALQIENLGTGQIGSINIAAEQLLLQQGGRIVSQTFGPGSGGSVDVKVSGDVAIEGFLPANPGVFSTILANTFSPLGNSGNITITSENLRVLDGGAIGSATFSTGQASAIQINTTDLTEIAGFNPFAVLSSAVSSSSLGAGNANDVTLNTSRLVVRDGALLGSTTQSAGASGNVIVTASESIAVRGRGPAFNQVSRILSAAEIVDPITQALLGLPPIPSGNSGSVTIQTPSLTVADQGTVSVRNDGPGTSGSLQINAGTTFLNNQGSLTANAQSGEGGNIALRGDALVLRQNSLINATAGGTGNGGNITINAPVIAGFENSDIIANAVQGNGGNIQITTQGIFGLEFRPQLTPENDITASSQFGVNGTVEINEFSLDPDTGIVELPAGLADTSDQIAQGCATDGDSSFIATGRGGIPPSPNERLSSDLTWGDTRDLSEFLGAAPSGPAATGPVPAQPPGLTEINAWRINANGQVELLAVNADAPASSVAYATCSNPT